LSAELTTRRPTSATPTTISGAMNQIALLFFRGP
jgi:hypothetical protein